MSKTIHTNSHLNVILRRICRSVLTETVFVKHNSVVRRLRDICLSLINFLNNVFCIFGLVLLLTVTWIFSEISSVGRASPQTQVTTLSHRLVAIAKLYASTDRYFPGGRWQSSFSTSVMLWQFNKYCICYKLCMCVCVCMCVYVGTYIPI